MPDRGEADNARPPQRGRWERSRAWRLRRFQERAAERAQGEWAGKGVTGEAFDEAGHLYSKDFNVFGEGSLFELLCIARTGIGFRGLAKYLLQPAGRDEILARQAAVRELQGQRELRDRVAVLGEFEFSESKWETFAEWLSSPPVTFPAWLRFVAPTTSAIVAGIVVAGMVGFVSWTQTATWIAPLVLFHAGIGLAVRERVTRIVTSVRSVSLEIGVLREGLELLEAGQFESAKLSGIAAGLRGSAKSVRTLERLLNALDERNKEWFYFPSLIVLGGTQLCMAIEGWRSVHGAGLRGWLEAWGEFEALNALANYAHENPENTFPEIVEGAARFEAQAVGHPLLPAAGCVRNDVELNAATRFWVVSGSNMAGKSTLLRAIGLNAVLAYAGAPVRARSLRLAPMAVCASLAVTDSLLHGKSKFLAEVERLRQTIEAAGRGPALFLIDEIFSGTNSRDRRVAAEAVVRALVESGAVGTLSTHDMALTEMAEALGGANVHMGAREGGDPMDFDYRVKAGVTTETNALAIARMAGVKV